MAITLGRNEPCHCGSGKKYKKCHLEKDEVANRKEREKAALNAAKVAAAEADKEGAKPTDKRPPAEKPSWMQKVGAKVGFFKSSQRRVMNKGG